MCRAVTCRTCGKVTWAGCGEHVEDVLGNVPRAQRCAGHDDEPSSGSFLTRLFTRSPQR